MRKFNALSGQEWTEARELVHKIGQLTTELTTAQKRLEKILTLSEELRSLLLRPIEELDLTSRTHHFLKTNNIDSIGDLVQYTTLEILTKTGLGRRSINEIREVLACRGLDFPD